MAGFRVNSNLSAAEREARAKGTLGYCAWDRLPLAYPGLTTQVEFEPIAFEAVRFERRTAAVESMRGEHAAARLEAFGREYRETSLKWLAASLVTGDKAISWWDHPMFRIPLAMGVIATILIAKEILSGQPPVTMIIIATVTIMFWLTAGYMLRRGRPMWELEGEPISVTDLMAALGARKCPDCGYGLSGVTPGIEPEKIGGVDVGPERCPECICKWPLVPPPGRFAPRRKFGRGFKTR